MIMLVPSLVVEARLSGVPRAQSSLFTEDLYGHLLKSICGFLFVFKERVPLLKK